MCLAHHTVCLWCSPRRWPLGATNPVQIHWNSARFLPLFQGRWLSFDKTEPPPPPLPLPINTLPPKHHSILLLPPSPLLDSKRIASIIGVVDRDSNTRVSARCLSPGALCQLQPMLDACPIMTGTRLHSLIGCATKDFAKQLSPFCSAHACFLQVTRHIHIRLSILTCEEAMDSKNMRRSQHSRASCSFAFSAPSPSV